jgi:hypothetical protein
LANATTSATRSYIATFTISVANTWEYKTITIPGDTSGTWAKDNTAGIVIRFDYGSGTNYESTASSWLSTDSYRTSGCVNLSNTSGGNILVSGVQLEKGSTATSFDYRPYGTELALCQRYYQKSFTQSVAPANNAGGNGVQISVVSGQDPQPYIPFPVEMRAAPTATLYNPYEASPAGQWYGSAFSGLHSANARALGLTTRGFSIDNTDVGASSTGWCEIQYAVTAEL